MAVEITSSTGSGENSSGADKGTPLPTTELKIGDKVVTVADVQNMLNQQALVTQGLQEVAVIRDALKRYDLDAEGFIANAEGAFAAMSKLIDEKIIDNQGNVLIKNSNEETLPKSSVTSTSVVAPSTSEDVATKALQAIQAVAGELSQIKKVVGAIDATQASLIRTNLETQLKAKHQILDGDDTSRIVAISLKDRTKDVFQHAAEFAKNKEAMLQTLREKHAKEFGVDLKSFDENKLMESGSGGAAAFFKGKKFSFRGKGDDVISPKKATQDYLARQMR